jgi:hypothetical protein
MKPFLLLVVAVGVWFAAPAAQAADKASFEGVRVCSKCHDLQGESWATTTHAKALDLLKPQARAEAKKKAKLDPAKDYSQDKDCLGCHTTGYGEPGGYDPALPPAQAKSLGAVGCESCHGAGSQFKSEHGDAEGRLKKGGGATPRKVLVEKGQNFNYEKACAACHQPAGQAHAKGPASPFTAAVDPKYAFDFDKAVRVSGKGKGVHDHFKLTGVFTGESPHRLRAEFQATAKEITE